MVVLLLMSQVAYFAKYYFCSFWLTDWEVHLDNNGLCKPFNVVILYGPKRQRKREKIHKPSVFQSPSKLGQLQPRGMLPEQAQFMEILSALLYKLINMQWPEVATIITSELGSIPPILLGWSWHI